MTSLRRKQIRSPAVDEEFLRTIHTLYFAISKLEKESRDLSERSARPDQQLLRTSDHPPENNSLSTPEFQVRTNQFLFAIGAEESSQRLRDTLGRLHWKLVPECDLDESENDETEEAEPAAAVVVEEVTDQESEIEGAHKEEPRDIEAQTGSGQVAAKRRHGKIFGCFAALWSCSCE